MQPTTASSSLTSLRMSRVRRTGTDAELRVRKACTGLGLRYRVKNPDLPGSPDLANRAKFWAIFVHGCFWHRHARCVKATTPKTNTEFWSMKFEKNVERDRRVSAALRRRGYRVLTLWQCEVEAPAILTRRLDNFVHSLQHRDRDRA